MSGAGLTGEEKRIHIGNQCPHNKNQILLYRKHYAPRSKPRVLVRSGLITPGVSKVIHPASPARPVIKGVSINIRSDVHLTRY